MPADPACRAPRLPRRLSLLLCCLASCLCAADEPSAPARELRPLGQVFTLLQRREDAGVESEEYVPKGETPESWTQMLGVQRIRKPATPAALLAFLQSSLSSARGARVTLLGQGPRAGVLQASIPAASGAEAEELLCYVSESAERPGQLEALHYTLRPARVEASVAELQLQGWRERLLAQAQRRNAALAPAADPANE